MHGGNESVEIGAGVECCLGLFYQKFCVLSLLHVSHETIWKLMMIKMQYIISIESSDDRQYGWDW